MSWSLLVALGAVSYGLKAAGPVVVGGRELHARVRLVLDLVAVPLLAALVVVQTLSARQDVALDARVPAVAVAALLVWRRAPFLLVVIAAAATAAVLRAVRASG